VIASSARRSPAALTRPAARRHRHAVIGKYLLFRVIRCGKLPCFLVLGLELLAHRRNPGLERFALAFAFASSRLHFMVSREIGGSFACLLGLPCRSRKHAFRTQVCVDELEAAVSQEKLADLVGVSHAARFQDKHCAIALAAELDIP
jgi:hypothetical protein